MSGELDRREFAIANAVSLDEFKAYADYQMATSDEFAIAGAAPLLAGLAKNTDLLFTLLNERAENWFCERENASALTVPFASGQNYRLDAIAWPTAEEAESGRVPLDEVAYGLASDHVAHRLVAGYLGPGYDEDTYVYDRALIRGYAGEAVTIRKLGSFRLSPGTVVVHPACRHIHVRRAPSELSFSLVLSVATPEMATASSHFFDVATQTIIGDPVNSGALVRASLMELACLGAGGSPNPLMDRLADGHPDPQVRLAAYEALSQSSPEDIAALRSAALEDAHPYVVEGAKKRLGA